MTMPKIHISNKYAPSCLLVPTKVHFCILMFCAGRYISPAFALFLSEITEAFMKQTDR